MGKKSIVWQIRDWLFFYLFCLSLLISCSGKKTRDSADLQEVKPYPHFINMEEGLKNNTQLKLSDIADSIKYIVLSKDKEVLIGSARKIQMNDSNIFIKSENLIMRFDLSGNFLNSFGSLGRGPEEYLPGSPYSTTPDFDKVLVLRSMMQDYLIYNPMGEFIGKKEISYARNLYDFTCLSDSAFLMTFWFLGSFMNEDVLKEMPGVAGLYDPEGNPIQIIEHPLRNKTISKTDLKRIVSQNPTFTYFDNRVVLTLEGDTIYEISRYSIIPGFIFNWGQIPHKQSVEDIYFRQSEASGKATYFGSVLETSKGAYFRGRNMNEYYLFEYNKITGLTRSMKVDEDYMGFINDLDGGASYFPYWTNRSGNIWILVEDAYSFKEKHNEEFLSNSVALNPEMKERLRNFLNSLKQDDNPVLKIVYLKKDKKD